METWLKISFVIVLIVAYLFIFYNIYETRKEFEEVENTTPKDEIHTVKTVTERKHTVNEEDLFMVLDITESETNNHEDVVKDDVETDIVDSEPTLVSLGEFKLTGYCSCHICCNEWAYNRPKDEYGNDIVYGASGEILKSNYSIAVDPTIIPYGTEVVINGNTYKAQDCGGSIKDNRIDIYMSSHKMAKNFGVQYAEVFIKK